MAVLEGALGRTDVMRLSNCACSDGLAVARCSALVGNQWVFWQKAWRLQVKITYGLDRGGRYELSLKVEWILHGTSTSPVGKSIFGRHRKGVLGRRWTQRC